MKSISIENIKCSHVAANELLDFITTQDIPEKGLDSLTLSNFSKRCQPLDESILNRLGQSCFNLTQLTVSFVNDLNQENRFKLNDMVAQIVAQSKLLKHLNI